MLQLGFMLAQAAIFLSIDIYLTTRKIAFKRDDSPLVFNAFMLGTTFFMMQHALFVGMYLHVAVAIPNILCLQSDDVVALRIRNS